MDKRKRISFEIPIKIDWEKYTIEEMQFFEVAFNYFFLDENKENEMLDVANKRLPYEIQNLNQLDLLYQRFGKATRCKVKYLNGVYYI